MNEYLNTGALVVTAAFAALAVFLGVYVVSKWVAREFAPPDAARSEEKKKRARPYFLSVLGKRLEPLLPQKLAADLHRQIIMAGGLEGMTPAEVVITGLVLLGLALTVGFLIIATSEWSPWTVSLICVAGAVVPFVWLRDQVKKRHLEILRDLPFHLDLLTLSVEAGLDFAAAVSRMVEKGKAGPLREEFSSFLGEVRMGKTRAEALESMSDRVGLPALSSFISALIQADRMGSGLGRTLRVQAEQMRTDRFQRAEKLAGEAPVKMLIPLVIFIFPTIWIILSAPLVFEWLFKGM